MISRRSKKPFLKSCLSLLMLVACLLVLQTMVARPSYGQTAASFRDTQGRLHVILDDATPVYARRAVGALTDAAAYRFRHTVDPNGISMPDRAEITLTQLRKRSPVVETRLQYGAGCYRLYVRYVDDNRDWHALPVAFISDAGHHIEVLVEFASSPSAQDGRITYWIDDLAIGRHENLDLYDRSSRPDHVRLGAPWVSDAAIRGTLHVDQFVLREGAEYIGPEETQPGTQRSTPRLTEALPVYAR